MTKVNLELRRMAAIIACIATTMMFASCEPTEDGPKPDTGTEQEEGQKPDTETEQGGGNGDFQKRTFATVKEVIDFIPEGVWIYEYENKSWNNDITLFSKASDGSFTFSEMEGDPKNSHYGDVGSWYVWKGESFHSVKYTNDSKKNVTTYWQVRADYPGENLTQSTDTMYGMKSMSVSTPWGGIPTAMPAETSEPFSFLTIGFTPFLAFITSDECEEAVFDGNAEVAGIACKRYRLDFAAIEYQGIVLQPAYSKYYYVLDNGFCLKEENQNPMAMTNFTLNEGERTAATCDAVLQKYYQDSDVFNNPESIGSMQVLTHLHNGPEWVAGAPAGNGGWVIPWTAGGIKYMSLFYELGDSSPHTFTAELDQAAFTDAQRTAYINQVKAIQYMKVTSDSDIENEYMRTIYFESNNDDKALMEGVDFGEHYYYIGYDFGQTVIQGKPASCSISIFWVRVTIV